MPVPIYFCWERTMSGQWGPVCYHGEKPPKEKVADGDRPRRSNVWDVPEHCLRATDREPMFGRLAILYPAPEDQP